MNLVFPGGTSAGAAPSAATALLSARRESFPRYYPRAAFLRRVSRFFCASSRRARITERDLTLLARATLRFLPAFEAGPFPSIKEASGGPRARAIG